jgi:hypothetical protein
MNAPPASAASDLAHLARIERGLHFLGHSRPRAAVPVARGWRQLSAAVIAAFARFKNQPPQVDDESAVRP